jgi:hypothetical protein
MVAAAVLCLAARSPETLTWQRELVLGLWDDNGELFSVLGTVQKNKRRMLEGGFVFWENILWSFAPANFV